MVTGNSYHNGCEVQSHKASVHMYTGVASYCLMLSGEKKVDVGVTTYGPAEAIMLSLVTMMLAIEEVRDN